MSGPFPPPPPSAPVNASTNPFPLPTVALTDNGFVTPPWLRLLTLLWTKAGGSGAGAVQGVTVGTSPFTYTAKAPGTLVVSGGTVSAIALIRDRVSVSLGVTAGPIPLRSNDQVQMTYSSIPTVDFVPL